MLDQVREQLVALPRNPGVYLFRDEADDVLYVGKAKSLRSRVRSYFNGGDGRMGIGRMVGRVARIEVIVTSSEAEALHLEQNLVKRHRPPFNVRLRDDKSFPYIAVTAADEYPRVMFTRERHRRGTVYFGPYANAKKVRETLDVLNRVFQFRPCEGPKPGRHSGIPCLDFHIERCTAPCIGAISKEAYREQIDGVIEFLSGDTRSIVRSLEARMREAAAEERFEDATRYRNRLHAIESLAERQGADRRAVGTIDVIGLAVDGDRAAVQLFPLRDGRLIDRYAFHLENVEGQDRQTILEGFCLEYYTAAPSVPPQLIVPSDLTDTEGLAGFLSELRGAAVEVRAPARGRVVFTTREHVIAIEPRGKGLLGITLRYPYEIRSEEDYFGDLPDAKVPKDMLDLAVHVIRSKEGHFVPGKVEDCYEKALKELIRKKQQGKKIEKPKEHAPAAVINLMDALRRSAAERRSMRRPVVQGTGGIHRRGSARRSSTRAPG